MDVDDVDDDAETAAAADAAADEELCRFKTGIVTDSKLYLLIFILQFKHHDLCFAINKLLEIAPTKPLMLNLFLPRHVLYVVVSCMSLHTYPMRKQVRSTSNCNGILYR